MTRFRFSLLVSLSIGVATPAVASPVFDAVADKRYTDAIAASAGNDLMFSYARWAALSQPGGQIFLDAGEAISFLRQHRNWPLENRVRISVEAAQLRDGASGADAQWMCNELKPISGRGMVACANLYSQTDPQTLPLVKRAWLQGDFDASEEKDILARYGQMLKTNDHAARTERLLFEGKIQAAQRMLPFLSAGAEAIADARIALITGNKRADAKIAALPASSRNAPGIVFDRIRFRHKKGLTASALDLFAASPTHPPYSELWWPLRHYYAREAMANGQYSKALTIVRKSAAMDNPEYMSEALWLSGWLRLEYLKDSRAAYSDFQALYDLVKTPVSKSRAAYWAGRAAERSGNSGNEWFEKAAQYRTVFYGQLAYAKLHPGKPLDLPDSVSGSGGGGELAQLAEMLDASGDAPRARIFWEQAAANTQSSGALASMAERANKVRGGNAVRIAKAAIRQNIILLKQGWPVIDVPDQCPIEPALTLAISRQESEFDPMATSSANAQGLMQLLPRTASVTCKNYSLPYSHADLFTPMANLTIGSTYLSELIDKMGGSYVAGIASYNAGPGAALRWINDNGRPGQSIDQSLRWIESIPYGETRNYVQRVLENLQVYRARLKPGTPLGIEQDLTR